MTAFMTHGGLFYYYWVPYVIASVPTEIHKLRMMVLVCQVSRILLCNFIKYGNDACNHDRLLHNVLSALKRAGLQLNTDKCKFSFSVKERRVV